MAKGEGLSTMAVLRDAWPYGPGPQDEVVESAKEIRLMFSHRLAGLAALLIAAAMPAAAQTPAPADKITIGVSLAQDDNPFYIAMLKGIRARAQELGWDVVSVSANEDKLKQINGVQDLVARGVKGILISPIDSVGVNAAYDAAAAAKVPIVSVARGSASPNQTIHVAMDEKQIGRDIAEWTAKRLGGKGQIAMLLGPSGAPTFKNLADGYMEVMAKYPDIKIVSKADGPLTRERGVKQAEDALVANPDLAAIYTANDDVALGATQAVLAANRKGKTIVTGMNGVPPALRAVKDDNMAMTVELNPVEWGRLGVDVLATYLKGDKVNPQVFIKHQLIDSANVDSKLPKS
jgi:ribose transport system substrate-binding protein